MSKLIFGVGTYEKGAYTSKDKKEYQLWRDVLKRCYKEEVWEKHPNYKNVFVCEEWLTYNNFAKDINNMIGFKNKDAKGRSWDLDKDLLSNGKSKLYSKENCVFIPREINSFLANVKSNKGNMPTGIRISNNNKKRPYCVTIGIDGKNKDLGNYTDLNVARKIYVDARNKRALDLAERYKTEIDQRAYNMLVNWNEEEYSN